MTHFSVSDVLALNTYDITRQINSDANSATLHLHRLFAAFDDNMENFKPEKLIWDEADFEKMGWHDCSIYGIHFADNVALDIDYIFKWVLNDQDGHYRFWISPATLVFEHARNLQIDIDLDFVNGLEIADIHQEKIEMNEYKYHIDTQEGNIRLIASGYKQFIKKYPSLKNSQCLTEEERNGYSFKIK